MKEINLDVNEKRIKIAKKSNDAVLFDYDLKFGIDLNAVKANWGKKTHLLKITTKKL